MNKTCARCQKVVYPIEELKCLDKTWHKTCFKCTECGMTLNMKTYKGYNKMPYCEAHIPKAKATAIADTPELKRIAENTKIQSNVKYHEDFEKAKGKFTQVADDPETLRIKQNTKIISNVAYHGDLEKKAQMERQRGAAELSETRGTIDSLTNLELSALLERKSYYTDKLINGVANCWKQQMAKFDVVHNSNHHQQQMLQQQSSHQHQLQQPQQQQQQQQPNNSYVQMRSAILQSSHNPTGALLTNDNQISQHHHHNHQQQPQPQQATIPTTPVPLSHRQFDQYDNNYQRPSANTTNNHIYHANNNHNNNNNNNNNINNTTTTTNAMINANNSHNNHNNNNLNNYQQQQQQQQHTVQNNTTSMQQLYASSHYNMYTSSGTIIPPTSNASLAVNSVNNSKTSNNVAANVSALAQTTPHVTNSNGYNSHHNANGITATTAVGVGVGVGGSSGIKLQQQKQQQSHQTHMIQHHHNQPSQQQTSASLIVGNVTNINGSNGSNIVAGIHTKANAKANNIGKIADYDPLTDGPRQLPNTARQSTTLIYSSDNRNNVNNVYPKRIGSVADIDPVNGVFGSLAVEQQIQQQQSNSQQQSQQYGYQHSQHSLQSAQSKSSVRIYRALYDYEAQDVDEVSFREGDIIFEVESIDSGWMTGRVERTGKTGMLPANYVEQAVI